MIRDVLGHRSVLVLEDNYFIAEDLCAAIEQAGGRVLGPAAFVEEALALLLERECPDAAILDIDLNGSQSFAVADALARLNVPTLFVTGFDLPAIPDAQRVIPVCRKPMRAAEVVRALTRILL